MVFGHSHLDPFIYAQQARIDRGDPIGTHLHCIQMQSERFRPNITTIDGRTVLHPELRQRIETDIAGLPRVPPFVCATVSGNEYFFVGHTEHPRPFDFVLPDRPELPVRTGVEIIPPSLMRATLERSTANALAIMSALSETIDLPVVFIQSPPPVQSDEHIRNNPGPFKEAIDETGVAPASLRMKLWLLQSLIYRRKCDELGWRFLDVPQEVLDSEGFLQQCAAWPDSVHGNVWYADIFLRRIDTAYREALIPEVAQ